MNEIIITVSTISMAAMTLFLIILTKFREMEYQRRRDLDHLHDDMQHTIYHVRNIEERVDELYDRLMEINDFIDEEQRRRMADQQLNEEIRLANDNQPILNDPCDFFEIDRNK